MLRPTAASRALIVMLLTLGLTMQAHAQKTVSSADLQIEVQRFTMSYLSIIGQALDELEATIQDPKKRAQIQDVKVAQIAAAFNIAIGEKPGMNLLDIIVLVALSRTAVENHWAPQVFGTTKSKRWIKAAQEMEKASWTFAGRFLLPAKIERLRQLIETWRKDYPDVYYVEGIRINEFLNQVRIRSDGSSIGLLSFLLPSVGETGEAIDRARLLGERAVLLAQYFPMLSHQQTKLLLFELLAEPEIRQFLDNSNELTTQVNKFNKTFDTMPERVARRVTSQRRALLRELDERVTAQRRALLQDVDARVSAQRVQFMRDIDERQKTIGSVVGATHETVNASLELAKEVNLITKQLVPLVDRAQKTDATVPGVLGQTLNVVKELNVLTTSVQRLMEARPGEGVATSSTRLMVEARRQIERASNHIFYLLLILVPFSVLCCVAGAFGYRLLERRQNVSRT